MQNKRRAPRTDPVLRSCDRYQHETIHINADTGEVLTKQQVNNGTYTKEATRVQYYRIGPTTIKADHIHLWRANGQLQLF